MAEVGGEEKEFNVSGQRDIQPVLVSLFQPN